MENLGANEFTFTGDRTTITFRPIAFGPLQHDTGSELIYAGPETQQTFRGDQVQRVDCALGTLISVVLLRGIDVGSVGLTLVVPPAIGVQLDHPVTFGTLAIKSTSRGFIDTPGVEYTYDVLPLVGEAKEVLAPLGEKQQVSP